MVRGLASKWKQCVSYFLTSGPVSAVMLQCLTKDAVGKLQKIGLHVKALVCDQGSNNRSFLESMEKISEEKPYLMVNNSKVYFLYDPPHLLKNVRNNLKKHGFIIQGDEICWQHIKDFYEYDQENDIRMAPKLTNAHIELPPFSPMRVNLAAQVLSATVAAGINTLVNFNKLPKPAAATAKFIKHFDSLFNCFNSQSVNSNQPFCHALSNATDHKAFLRESLAYLSSLRTPSGQQIHCIRGWKISIQSLLLLWEDLRTNCGFNFLLTGRLNQDLVENLFSVIRGRGGHRDNPDVREFRAAFRQVLFDQMLVPSKSSNCSMDLDSVLLNMTNFSSELIPSKRNLPVTSNNVACSVTAEGDEIHPDEPTTSAGSSSAIVRQSDRSNTPWVDNSQPVLFPCLNVIMMMKPVTSIPKQNIVAYIAGYLLKRCAFKDCDECANMLTFSQPPAEPLYEFLKNKAYKENSALVYPTQRVIQFVDELETIFVNLFETVVHSPGVMMRLCKNAEFLFERFVTCNSPKCVSKVQNLVKMYMKLRMFFALKLSNRENRKAGTKRNRKMIKLQHL